MKKSLLLFSAIMLTLLVLSSCSHRDCQGKKKTCKTEMGGWL